MLISLQLNHIAKIFSAGPLSVKNWNKTPDSINTVLAIS